MRSLPPTNNMQYHAYKIVKYVNVKSSIIAPAFNNVGYGIQYHFPVGANTLIELKIIVPIK
ncbi:MAG: hypothetical protein F083_2887 [bacterium F083]|nr:MAG: hypothetical protein F083_2887 [bacterium F083]